MQLRYVLCTCLPLVLKQEIFSISFKTSSFAALLDKKTIHKLSGHRKIFRLRRTIFNGSVNTNRLCERCWREAAATNGVLWMETVIFHIFSTAYMCARRYQIPIHLTISTRFVRSIAISICNAGTYIHPRWRTRRSRRKRLRWNSRTRRHREDAERF